MRCFTAGGNDEGVRLSRFVQRVARHLPSSLMYKSFRNKRIKVNGKRGQPEYRLLAGDVIELYINDEFFTEGMPEGAPIAKQVPYSTVWENEGLAILYKPAGVLCHSDTEGDTGLLEAYTAELVRRGEYDPAEENGFAPALCNRLDRGTEGLLILAKRYAALRDTNRAIQDGLVVKTYLAVTVGAPPEGMHKAWLVRDKTSKLVTVSAEESEGAKAILTEVRVLGTKGTLSLVEVTLHTGRTHQIRAHLAFLGAPIAGDRKYGGRQALAGKMFQSQALCAWKVSFAQEMDRCDTTAALAGQSFTADMAVVPTWWERYD